MKLWVRVGDQDDYNPFDSIEEAAEHVHWYLHLPCENLFDEDAEHDVTHYKGPALVGIEVEEYSGDNGVSFYWGDDDAQKDRDITDHELDQIRDALANGEHE